MKVLKGFLIGLMAVFFGINILELFFSVNMFIISDATSVPIMALLGMSLSLDWKIRKPEFCHVCIFR
ncbi:MAG: hypothetical protein FWC75_05800 [Oscillospiraceae bacterium]|nr:hypothetical protein [Oscillospiraceae bacterium]